MNACDTCIHGGFCGYFDVYDNNLTSEENFIKYCVGCCCSDCGECNRWNETGIFCSNWEDGTEPLMG